MSIAINNLDRLAEISALEAKHPAAKVAAGKPASAKAPHGRLLFIDGLRGLAALFVMMFHLYTPIVSKLYLLLHPYMPFWLDWGLLQGYIGVEIFFVVSGFVIAYTLRNEACTPKFAANFMIRRSIRLDPPYWAVIFLSIGYRCVLWHHYTADIMRFWGLGTLLLNMFYLADLAHRLLIVGVAWTLCLEVQFYLSMILSLSIAHQFRRQFGSRVGTTALVSVFTGVTVYSIFYRYSEGKMNFFGMWFMFAMGAALAWTFTGKLRERWFWALVSAVAAGQLWRVDFRINVAIATVLLIYLCIKLKKMEAWLDWAWIQYLGKISYSLYLIHVAVGVAVIDIFLTYGDGSPLLGVFAFFGAIGASIIAANVLHNLVEAPCVRLAKRLKLKPSSAVKEPVPARAAESIFEPTPQAALAV